MTKDSEVGFAAGGFKEWQEKEKVADCPKTPKPIVDFDAPFFDVRQGQRLLQFRIIVRKAPGCPCPADVVSETATQFLEAYPGEILNPPKTQTFTVPNGRDRNWRP